MNLFADYIHPLTNWLQHNPRWSLFITFFIAMSESLAIIGSIVPGSVTMTAIGILAGSGIMRIDLTLIASTLGAICGDTLSYALGYIYSDKLMDVWPFRKYPKWIEYGKNFFSRHGGKSVLIGRFVGPLRSIIPVIAGVVHMKQGRFLVANVISAIGWSLIYVMPGVLIGAAGHELSAESATRLFVIILALLFALWFISLLIKWILIKLHAFLKNNLHDFWAELKNRYLLGKIFVLFTPKNEMNYYYTAGLVLVTLLCLSLSVALIMLSFDHEYFIGLNVPVHLFLQSFHTTLLEAFFICCTQLTSSLTIGLIYASCCLWLVYNKKLHTLVYLSTLVISTCLLSTVLNHFIASPRPQGILITMQGNSFPNTHLVIATALYGFIFYYINNRHLLLTNTLRTFILIVLGLSGIGALYLDDYWLTDVLAAYLIGVAACLTTCLLYRKNPLYDATKLQSAPVLVFLFIALIGSSAISTFLNFKILFYAHTPYQKEYTLDPDEWWNQQTPILPLYHMNRVGKRASLLNIEYSGNLDDLQSKLENNGWEAHNEPFFKKLLINLTGNANQIKLPLFTQLNENRRPELTMVYRNPQKNTVVQLTVWESHYNLQNADHPLWIGTMYPTQQNTNQQNILDTIIPVFDTFVVKKMRLSSELLKSTLYPYEPYILLIKNKEQNN